MSAQASVKGGLLESLDWLNTHKTAKQKFFYDLQSFGDPGVRLATHTPLGFCIRPSVSADKTFGEYQDYTPINFIKTIPQPDFKYLIFQSNTQTDTMLKSPEVKALMDKNEMQLQLSYSYKEHYIYTILH